MHPEFADWYRLASVDVNNVDLKARWAGVDAARLGFSSGDLLDASRVFYGMPPKSPNYIDRFRHYFKSADDKFRMLDNNAEVRVLSGATLVALFTAGDEWANTAALAITCPSFMGARASAAGDIERLARETIASRSISLREPEVSVQLADSFLENTQTHIASLLSIVKTNSPLSAVHDELEQVLDDVASGLKALAEWTRVQHREQALRVEESNVLWWLYGGYSRDLKIAFSAIKPSALPVIAGVEMADLTAVIPGAHSARAFLDKVIRDHRDRSTVTLADAVTACPANWRQTVVARGEVQPVEDLCPTLFAIHKADGG